MKKRNLRQVFSVVRFVMFYLFLSLIGIAYFFVLLYFLLEIRRKFYENKRNKHFLSVCRCFVALWGGIGASFRGGRFFGQTGRRSGSLYSACGGPCGSP
jgi:hypothetical protein